MYRYEFMINNFKKLREFKGFMLESFYLSKIWFEKRIGKRDYLIEYTNGITDIVFQPKIYLKNSDYEYKQVKHLQTDREIQVFVQEINKIIKEANSDYEKIMPNQIIKKEGYRFIIRDFYEANGSKATPLEFPEEIRINVDISEEETIIGEIEIVIKNENYKKEKHPHWKYEKCYKYGEREVDMRVEKLIDEVGKYVQKILNKPYRFMHLHKEAKEG